MTKLLGTGAAFAAANDDYLAATARAELAYGKSELAVSAFYGMRTDHTAFTGDIEPCTDGHSPCDFAQTERLNHVKRDRSDVGAAMVRSSVRQHASTKRARACEKRTATPDAFNNASLRDAIYADGVARDTGVRNVRDIRDGIAGRMIVSGRRPLPAPSVDLSLVIRDLPDRQRSVAERLMAGDSAADIARDDNVSRVAISLLCNKIRRALLAADPSLAMSYA